MRRLIHSFIHSFEDRKIKEKASENLQKTTTTTIILSSTTRITMLIPSTFSTFASSYGHSTTISSMIPTTSTTSLSSSLHDNSMMMTMASSSGDADWKSLLLTTIIRGGELFARQHTEHLDISRVRMRLEGLQAYGTLCALLANGCLRLYSSISVPTTSERNVDSVNGDDTTTTKKGFTKKLRKRLAYDGFFLCVVLSVLSGAYTTVVFTLLPLYSKMALGRGYDKQFLEFWAATAQIRETGFTAFLSSLVSFEIAFVLSLYLRTRGRRKRMLVTVATIICLASFWEWTTVMKLASKYLFTLHAEKDY